MNCACQSDDPYRCFAVRYEITRDAHHTLGFAVEMDGGPCSCPCHDVRDEQEEREIDQQLSGRWEK